MKNLEQYKAENKQLQAERLAMRGMLEKQGQTVDMAKIEQIGERITRLMREDRAGDYTLAIDRPLKSLVTSLESTLEPVETRQRTIQKPATRAEYDGLAQEDKRELMASLGQAAFVQMLSGLQKDD